MFRALPYKTKQFFFVLIKFSIVVLAFYFIYNKLTTNDNLNFSAFVAFLSKNNVFSLKNASLLVILSVFNWFFEILKWQNLASFVKKINFKKALQESLGALTASLFTPNRIGDYGAKAMCYTSTLRKRIMLLNFLSNLMQMSITVIFGVIGLSFFISKYNVDVDYYNIFKVVVLLIIIAGFVFFGTKQNRFKIKGISIEKIKTFIKRIPLKIHFYNFNLSLIRYFIFSFQFYFLLLIFEVDINYINAMVIITSMYVLASVIPSIFVFDVVIKGSVAVYLFSIAGTNEITILCIVTLMWLLNFVLPSIIGSYYVLNFNLPSDNN